ncbi:hypothetical protein [Alteromonas gilva]|uniref:Uracil-DNA glycosylase-like domain-containing protein n=1 Tax=Alteromonas gilva TaxID=2987522 RepID=A0ABT5L6Y9_9ALTE|nr:hypothetical protein [Alteromonas gilva]MDC8832835.1 hypothetical protein [Alteromonas gilva]
MPPHKYKVSDVTQPESDVIFILESPHKTELEKGYPAAGDTGINMSRELFNNETALGELVANSAALPYRISLLNSSQYPLQYEAYPNPLKVPRDAEELFDLKKCSNNDEMNEVLSKPEGVIALNDFRERLQIFLDASKKAKVVVCGKIAQCFFESGKIIPNTSLVFYSPHPSGKAGGWKDQNMVNNLRQFLRQPT